WRRQREFAARFERNFEPLCCMPVRAEEGSDAVGLLWVQDGATYGTSDNRNLSVFLRGMLLDDNARELLPPWAGFIGGVIESNRLTPTASREDLQRD
ncbi:MAG: molecular chaperone HtpG, partial [Xanthomonas perforans]|nr:molecular chaperone HtpG [Xanthomonas perforans]